MRWTQIESPLGPLLLAADEAGLRRIHFQAGPEPLSPPSDWARVERLAGPVQQQLDEYFDGQRQEFDLDLAPEGTPFQREVWEALAQIPYGTTESYGQLAGRIGRPRAVRAVGAANARNPLPIVLPCHRVIGSDGQLTGFGGGIEAKRFLLSLEHEHAPAASAQLAFL